MTNATQAAAALVAAPAKAWPMYRALVGVGLACGALIVSVFQITEPIIRANKIEARNRAVLHVLPGATESGTFREGEGGRFEATSPDDEGGALVFAGYDDAGALVGLAVETQAMGYQDVVRIIYGYAPAKQAVIGFTVLDSRETPGLGDRVETDPQYLANFEQLDVSLDPSGAALSHEIETVKPGTKTSPWQIDTITGATITSSAIARMLRDSTAVWIPRLHARLDDFQREPR